MRTRNLLIGGAGLISAAVMLAAVGMWLLIGPTTCRTRPAETTMSIPVEKNPLAQRLPAEILITCNAFRAKSGKDRRGEAEAIVQALGRLDPRQPKEIWESVRPDPPVTMPEIVALIGLPDEEMKYDATGRHDADDPVDYMSREHLTAIYNCGRCTCVGLLPPLPPPRLVVVRKPESDTVEKIFWLEYSPRP
jgi:hypothetical protein